MTKGGRKEERKNLTFECISPIFTSRIEIGRQHDGLSELMIHSLCVGVDVSLRSWLRWVLGIFVRRR